MALQKTIKTRSGHDVSYLHIHSARIELNGYIDEEHRRAGKYQPETIQIRINAENAKADPQIAALYRILGTLAPDFADAEPVLEEGQSLES